MPDIDSTRMRIPASLGQAGSAIRGKSAELQTHLDLLKSKLIPLEAWLGTTSVDYQEYQQMWNVAAANLFGEAGVLGEIARRMDVVAGNYAETESANTATWKH